MTHLLDTDTCIGVLRQRPGMVQRLSQVAPTDCAVSMVTVYELFCGVEKSQDPAKERQKVERFVSAIIELPLDRAAAETAARIRIDLEKRGQPIGPYDLLIAGQALASGLTLVTSNVQEFPRRRTEAGKLAISVRSIEKILNAAFCDDPPPVKELIDYDPFCGIQPALVVRC